MQVLFRVAILCAAPVVWGALAALPVCAQFSFTPASELPGGGFQGTPTAISGDGSTIIGNLSIPMGREGFRWNAESGMIRLGDLPGGTFNSTADDVSYDGSIVVGSSIYRGVISNGALFRGWQPYRWTSENGMVGLGLEGMASAVSADGSVVVGFNDFGSIRWTLAEGASYVTGPTPFPTYQSGATDVSADGAIVIGWTRGATSQSQAFRWTHGTGLTSLDPANYAYHISADGRAVIGSNRSTRAIRWTQEDGWTAIGHPELYAGAMSADGSTIVGLDSSGEASEAFFWTPSSGVVKLQDYLLANGVVEVQDWTLNSAIDVSADGRTILGVGANPLGQTEAWLATIPEPSSAILVAAALVAIAASRILSRTVIHRCFLIAFALLAFATTRPVAAQFSFTPASELPGGGFQGNPSAISGDGTTVVGWTDSPGGNEAFRYSTDSGMVLLGDLPGGRFESRPHAVSHDGSIVMGASSFQIAYGTGSAPVLQPFQWSAEHGMVGIGFAADAAAMTADGIVIVGSTNSGVFRWSATQGPVYVFLPSRNHFLAASDASADGNTIVGLSRNMSGQFEAFRWTADGGVSLIGPGSYASDVSGDGRVIIGWHGSAGGS
jgi:probable HAF family extracellular repeat protein